jgi:phosphoglycolate phosphatase-like HAD superfamily hydrolase
MHRLVLFDIDCTLIDAHGAGGRAIFQAMKDVYGLQGELGGYSFHGRTDPGIVRDLATLWGSAEREAAGEGGGEDTQPEAVAAVAGRLGYPSETVDELLPACLTRYVELLRDEVEDGVVEVLPGIAELVQALAADRLVTVGLLTGNVEEGARIKLAPTGLWPLFAVGAFGSDSAHRPDLPAVAVSRAERLTRAAFVGKDIVIVGDTPADIQCGEHLGVSAVAVATGRYTRDELAVHIPDHLFDDFSDWRGAYHVMAGEGETADARPLTEN